MHLINVDLSETVYMHSTQALLISRFPHMFVLLQSSLYGHEKLPRCLFQRCDSSLFNLIHRIIDSLHKEFDMTDLGALNYFLGISAVRHSTGLFLSQKMYVPQLLAAHMVNCNVSETSWVTDYKLVHGDLSYAVQQICLYMHDPRESHFAALKRIMRYVLGTLDLGLHLYASSYYILAWLHGAVGLVVSLLDCAEAEYRGVANVVAETAWIRNLLCELHSPLLTATLVYCDNVSAVYMSEPGSTFIAPKHIEIDIHFVRDIGLKFVRSSVKLLGEIKDLLQRNPTRESISPDMDNGEVSVAGMGIHKADGQNDIPNANDNAVNQGIIGSANDPMLDVLIQVACDGMGIDKADGNNDYTYSQREPSTLDVLVQGFNSQKNHPRIDVLQHDTHADCSVAKLNDHSTTDISVKAAPVDEFSDDYMDVLNDEESIPNYSLDDMKLTGIALGLTQSETQFLE
ncbi:ribonuclease H-like domain-containing protein [Tanacetum coccineum]